MKNPANGASPKRAAANGRSAKVRSFSATDEDVAMLDAVAAYHGFTKSGTLVGLIRREFWRLFPAGTGMIKPAHGARVKP